MSLLALVVILSWAWMMATSFHFNDARTEVRRHALLARQPAAVDLPSRLRDRLNRRVRTGAGSGGGGSG